MGPQGDKKYSMTLMQGMRLIMKLLAPLTLASGFHLSLHFQVSKGSNMAVTSNNGQVIIGLSTCVIVMTFWYVFGTDLVFSNFLNFYFLLGIDHNPPCFLCSHDLCLFLSYVSLFTQSHGQEKSLSYYDLFDFGVLFYRRIPTLIFFYFLHNPTTPILPVYIDQ